MGRIRINTELEQASVEAAIITTDGAGNAYYLLPGTANTYLKFNGGSLEWTTVATTVGGTPGNIVAIDGSNQLVSNYPVMTYDLMYSRSNTPKITADANAGVNAVAQINGTHKAGLITLQTGALVNAGPLMKIDYDSMLYAGGSSVVLFPFNAATADVARSIYATGSGLGFVVLNGTSISPNTAFAWHYIVEGY